MISFLLLLLAASTQTAPAPCRSCTKNCYAVVNGTLSNGTNTTDVDLIAELELNEIDNHTGNRQKREIEYRACSRFQIEMLLIPLAIAMIPLVLCALFVCTCCCGPKESRGKMPEEWIHPMSKKRSNDATEEIELEWGDGYVQRKDSSKTKFSTTISYIEARRESLWSAASQSNERPSSADSKSEEKEKSRKVVKVMSADPIKKKTRFSDTVSVISLDRV